MKNAFPLNAALLALGEEAGGLTAADRQALPWTLQSMPEAGAGLFSLRDLLRPAG